MALLDDYLLLVGDGSTNLKSTLIDHADYVLKNPSKSEQAFVRRVGGTRSSQTVPKITRTHRLRVSLRTPMPFSLSPKLGTRTPSWHLPATTALTQATSTCLPTPRSLMRCGNDTGLTPHTTHASQSSRRFT